MVFYDYEVFKYDWLVVLTDLTADHEIETVIHNDQDHLQKYLDDHAYDIWVGYNSRHYDRWIQKAILSGLDAKEMNDWIIVKKNEPWQFSTLLRDVQFNNYDVMPNPPVGLKALEGFMGHNIKETSVPFDIDRKLTKEEIQQTIFYCRHDVHETIEVFFHRYAEFEAQLGIVNAFGLDLSCIGDTEARITAKVLECRKQEYTDEFDYFFLPCIRLKKYRYVMDWFQSLKKTAPQDPDHSRAYDLKRRAWYSQELITEVAGVPHKFGFGGLHGAIGIIKIKKNGDKDIENTPVHMTGLLLHVDVGSYYPSMLIAHGLVTRSARNDNYKKVYDTRMALKKAGKKKEQAPYKKLLNALSGAMKDKTNPAYDPRNNNCMCINGQLMLLDLIEHLEVVEGFELIQSNTDGLIIRIPDTDEAFDQVDDICWEWEQRCSTELCSILLGLDVISEIYQKDVNNYLWIDEDGKVERKGDYLKELSPIDYNLPILNTALVEYMVHKTPVEETINKCDRLIEFQSIVKLSDAYDYVEREHGTSYHEQKYDKKGKKAGKKLVYSERQRSYNKAYRVFASKDPKDGRLLKCRTLTDGTYQEAKFGKTPDKCFVVNDDITDAKCPEKLDRQWYIDYAKRRLEGFGIGQ